MKKRNNIPQMRGGPVQPKFLPKYTEEEQLTLDRAKAILAEEEKRKSDAEAAAKEILDNAEAKKNEILADALAKNESLTSENARLETENSELISEKEKILASFSAQKETLRLNDEAQAIIDEADKIRSEAKDLSDQMIDEATTRANNIETEAVKKEKEILGKAESDATEHRKKATAEAETIKKTAHAEADRIIEEANRIAADNSKKKQQEAVEAAKEILSAAHEEEQRIIQGKEQAAELAASSIKQSAEDYSMRIRTAADEYAIQTREQANKASAESANAAKIQAGKVLDNAQAVISAEKDRLQAYAERLHNDEMKLVDEKAKIPEDARRMAEERTSALRSSLEARIDKLAQKEGELKSKEDTLRWDREALEEEKRNFDQRLESAVQDRYASLQGALETARENQQNLSAKNIELNRNLTEVAERWKKLKGEDVAAMQIELEQLRADMRVFKECGISTLNAKAIANAQNTVVELRNKVAALGEELTEAKNNVALMAGNEEKLSAALSSSSTYERMVEDLMRKLDERKSVSRPQMLLPIQEPPRFLQGQRAIRDNDDYKNEIDWLNNIMVQSEKSGIILSERFLYAYHTSLKIGEWSPLVVLAGVSGTGKSELPKQYAHHGGMHFLSVPVKPDWDSPSSLFGYFNAIENRFEATELLRALYQMQEEYENDMFLVLLDEMNLAHPEQYFADLLSKFEENRGSEKPAEYDILLGAGEPPEKLSIARNVLWTGTMNEDETTKGLSDKVIDRSMLITFPCPKQLHDRDNTKLQDPRLTLSKTQWNVWKDAALSRTESKELEAQLTAKKQIIQDINSQMSVMGRNLGHRVWQSIENYILNYPTVISTNGKPEEVEKAFCDAIAFKMMPKLRGLETRGKNEDILSAIRDILPEKLRKDFNQACEQTSEVFRWNSAVFMEA